MPAPPKVASIHFAISSLKPPVAIKDLGTGTRSRMNLQRLDRDKPAGKKSPVCSCGKIRMVMGRDVPFSPPAPGSAANSGVTGCWSMTAAGTFQGR